MKTIKHTLKSPLSWGDEVITELEFRRPKGKDLYHFSDKPTTKEMATLAGKILVGENTSSKMIDELDCDDFLEVVEIVGNFFENSQKIGDKSSL